MNGATKTKYRPVLTSAQIAHIITLAKEDIISPASKDYELSISLLSSLAPFAAKVANAGITPAYTEKPTHQQKVIESLGGTLSSDTDVNFISGQTKEEWWKECYERYQRFGSDSMSMEEIAAMQEHRYLHALMSPEELEQFEGRN